ncbi:MAG TPA: hypothetical protein PLN63_08580 [Paludibacteraceae bacterium]|nr:hypothetical protein [Paludibacteraceae bacterium]
MENQEETHKRGGKREGAGRKSKYGATVNVNFRIDADLADLLNAQPNRSRFINEAIREKLQRNEKAL